jgi:hypothetical protein
MAAVLFILLLPLSMPKINNHVVKAMIMHCLAIIGKTKVEIKFNSKMIIYYKIRKRLRCYRCERYNNVYVPCLINRVRLSVAKYF